MDTTGEMISALQRRWHAVVSLWCAWTGAAFTQPCLQQTFLFLHEAPTRLHLGIKHLFYIQLL